MSTADVSALIEQHIETLRKFSKESGVMDAINFLHRLPRRATLQALSLPNGGEGPAGAERADAVLIERCARVIENHRPDASFDDSSAGYIERGALLKNIAAEVRALAIAPVPPSAGAEGVGVTYTSPLTAGWTPNERLCFDRAMKQWEGSLQRPDLSDQDRVAGALEAYIRQAYAIRILSALEPSHDTRAKALEEH